MTHNAEYNVIRYNHLSGGLVAQATATPVPLDLLTALIVVGLDRLDQLGQRGPVVGLDVGDGDARGGLASAHSAKPAKKGVNFDAIHSNCNCKQ